uniref:Uncharacterized protein n=1 Tax=Pseudo-nitzschia australis TaxID=44445 RepID=A0A7S4AA34_9STRA
MSSPLHGNVDLAQRLRNIFTPKRVQVLKKMGAGAVVSSIPVFVWWKWAIEQRHKRAEDVRTRVRVPNVQTIDDLMIERCRPGDILLFDRRWEHCAAGPLAALVCILGRSLLSFNDKSKSMGDGKFDHCGRCRDVHFESSRALVCQTARSDGNIGFENSWRNECWS